MLQCDSREAKAPGEVNSSPFPVAMTKGFHLFPFRTQQLSPSVPKVLGWTRPGRIGRCRIPYRSISIEVLLFFIAGDGIAWLAQPSPWLWWARHCRPGRIGRCRIPYRGISVEVLLFSAMGRESAASAAFIQPAVGAFVRLGRKVAAGSVGSIHGYVTERISGELFSICSYWGHEAVIPCSIPKEDSEESPCARLRNMIPCCRPHRVTKEEQ